MRKVLLAFVFSAFLAPGVHAMDDHGSHSGMAEGVHTTGTVHAIDADTVNLTHEPIPEIGWPSMTMDLPLLEGAETGDVSPGDDVTIMLEKGADGMYGVRALERRD